MKPRRLMLLRLGYCRCRILATLLAILLIWMWAGAARAEEDIEVYLPEPRPVVTELWQTIQMDKDAKITVWFEHSDPMELGDDISF